MTEERNLGGRPRHYKSPEEFTERVDEYMHSTETVTWTGLALYMGFCDRGSLNEYRNYDGFSHAVKRAHTLIEAAYEDRLNGDRPTGAIFALKNMNWVDKLVTENTNTNNNRTLEDVSEAELMAQIAAEDAKSPK